MFTCGKQNECGGKGSKIKKEQRTEIKGAKGERY
jgi:hypothetical protein